MRIALISLAIAAFVFIGSIIYMLLQKWWFVPARETMTSSVSAPMVASSFEIETLKQQIKLDAKIEELSKKIDVMSQQNRGMVETPKGIETNNTPMLSSASEVSPEVKPIPLSGKFLSKVMPELDFTLEKNNGIFDLHIFDQNIAYSTYMDTKLSVKAIAINFRYDGFLRDMRAVNREIYTVNEVKTFPFRAFYVNPPNPEGIVRLVIESEFQTIALEVPKIKFTPFKNLLTGNSVVPVKPNSTRPRSSNTLSPMKTSSGVSSNSGSHIISSVRQTSTSGEKIKVSSETPLIPATSSQK